MAGVVGYLHDKCGPISADLLPSDLQIFLLRNLSLDEIRNAYVCLKGEVIMFPNSIEHVMPQSSAKEHEIPKCDLNFPILTDLDAVIETVAIFLWYKPVTSDARYAASLAKAHQVLQARRSGLGPFCGTKRLFMETWSRHRLAVSMLYVSRYQFADTLMLDPAAPGYADRVDHLAADPQLLLRFLSNAKWVAEILTSRLHVNTAMHESIQIFPDSMASTSIPIRKLSRSTITAMQRFTPKKLTPGRRTVRPSSKVAPASRG